MKKYIVLLLIFIVISLMGTAQNVGIGSNAPLERLHVAGNIKADTIKPNAIKLLPNAGAGKVLTSDASGNATWQTSIVSPIANASGNVGYGVWGNCETNGILTEYTPLTDSLGNNYEYFGYSVAMSGSFAIVGSYNDAIDSNFYQGSASIYQFNGSKWVFMQKLVDSSGSGSDYFGTSVSISGNYAIVGSPGDNQGSFSSQGSASIYKYNGISWVFMQKLVSNLGVSNKQMGNSVSITSDGNYAIIGCELDDLNGNVDQGSASLQ